MTARSLEILKAMLEQLDVIERGLGNLQTVLCGDHVTVQETIVRDRQVANPLQPAQFILDNQES